MSTAGVSIEQLTTPTEEHAAAFARLIPQLSSTTPPTLDDLVRIAANPATILLIARDTDGEIVGSLTLVTFVIPTGVRAIVEDVVVDITARGRGVGNALVDEALHFAVSAGARNIDLTSRPSRAEANRLYERAGFVKRSTNVWRFSFD